MSVSILNRLIQNSLLLLISFFLGLISTPVEASDKSSWPVLRVTSFPIPPLLHTAEDGSFSGTVGETVLAICEKAEINCEVQVVPLSRAYHMVRKGAADALITLDFNQLNDCCSASEWFSPWSAGVFSYTPFRETPTKEEDMFDRHLLVVNGMKSPYLFMPNLDKNTKENKIRLSKAKDIKTAVSMFLKGRVPNLWGSDDFKWYMERMGNKRQVSFTPLVIKPIVLWVHNSKAELLAKFNRSFKQLADTGMLDGKYLLREDVMKNQYKDAPFTN